MSDSADKKPAAPTLIKKLELDVQPPRTGNLIRKSLNTPEAVQAKKDAADAMKAAVASGNAAAIESAKAAEKAAAVNLKRMQESVRVAGSGVIQEFAQQALLSAAELVRAKSRKEVGPDALYEAVSSPDFKYAFLAQGLPELRGYSAEAFAEKKAKRAAETKAKRLAKAAEKGEAADAKDKGKAAAEPIPAKDISFSPPASSDAAEDGEGESEKGAQAHPYANSIRTIQGKIRSIFEKEYGDAGKNFRFEGFTTEYLDAICRDLITRMTHAALQLFPLNRNQTFSPEHLNVVIMVLAIMYGAEEQGNALVAILGCYLGRFQEWKDAEKVRQKAAQEKKIAEMSPEDRAKYDAKQAEEENARKKKLVASSRAAAAKMQERLVKAKAAEEELKKAGITV